jgi:hypothetical protein
MARYEWHHRATTFDVMIIFNFKQPQVGSARRYTLRRGILLVLEYKDDVVWTVAGEPETGLLARYHHPA